MAEQAGLKISEIDGALRALTLPQPWKGSGRLVLEMNPYPGWQLIEDRHGAVHHLPTAQTVRDMLAELERLRARS